MDAERSGLDTLRVHSVVIIPKSHNHQSAGFGMQYQEKQGGQKNRQKTEFEMIFKQVLK